MSTSTATIQSLGHEQTSTGSAEARWNLLYRLGAAAALVAVVGIAVAIVVFIAWPPPTTVIGWFSLFQNNLWVALIDFDLLIVLSNVASILVLLALYAALRRTDESLMAVALALGLVGVGTYFASNPILSMLSLSGQYAAAESEVQRTAILAAGQSMLAIYQGTAFWISNALGGMALLLIAVVMRRSTVFGRVTADVGIAANVIGFGLFIPSTIGILLSLVSVVGLAIWYALIARKLFQLANVR